MKVWLTPWTGKQIYKLVKSEIENKHSDGYSKLKLISADAVENDIKRVFEVWKEFTEIEVKDAKLKRRLDRKLMELLNVFGTKMNLFRKRK